MFRPTFRIASSASPLGRAASRATATKRFVSTAPPHQKSRSWRNGAARWALAGGLVYYYNTATVFAEEPVSIHTPPETSRENEQYDTVASISEQRKAPSRSQAAPLPSDTQSQSVKAAPDGEVTASGSPEALEEEAEQQGAFNEETGEINWDCPCLGGMAYGPCGEEFRAAFSCFVFSTEEPKGVDCIDKFKGMQNCFREHPDVYGGELDDEGDEGAAVEQEEGRPVSVAIEPAPQAAAEAHPAQAATPLLNGGDSTPKEQEKERVKAATEQVRAQAPVDESNDVVPKAWHDTRSANEKE